MPYQLKSDIDIGNAIKVISIYNFCKIQGKPWGVEKGVDTEEDYYIQAENKYNYLIQEECLSNLKRHGWVIKYQANNT